MNTKDWSTSSVASRNLWRVASQVIAYTTITPIHYFGLIAGSEFLTYSATKIYIGLEVQILGGGLPGLVQAYITFHGAADAPLGNYDNISPVYNSSTNQVILFSNPLIFSNIWFSRLERNLYENIIFNGYRLTV